MGTTPSPRACATRPGRPCTNTSLPWPTGRRGDLFYYGDWIRTPGVAICSCNDGLRPVIFKLEATDQEAVIDDTPVQRKENPQ